MIKVGTLSSIHRYPVKSMQGEAVEGAFLSARGLLGDRAYALVDCESGHVVSAKHPRKWGRVLQCQAAYVAAPQVDGPPSPVRITLPDGRTVLSSDPAVDEALSDLLGRRVTLTAQVPPSPTREANRAPVELLATQEEIRQEPIARAAPPGTFFDFAPLHVLTTTTLARLGSLYPEGQFDVRRFRPNLVIDPAEQAASFPENAWLGQELMVGEGARLRLFDPTPRCVITTLPQGDLSPDIGILRTVAQHNAAISVTAAPGARLPAVAGVYAATDSRCTLRQGAEVLLLDREA